MDFTELYTTIRPRYPELAGRVALITGSSLGIGQGIALRLAREGMRVVIHGVEETAIAETVAGLTALGAEAVGIHADFNQPDGVAQLFAALAEHHTGLDVLVNNAADLRRTTFAQATAALLDTQIAVNIRAPYLCALQAAPLMSAGASIINISSVGGLRAHWVGLPYDVTKGAIDAMTRAMALELAGAGIRVNAIAPGAVRGRKTPPPDHASVRDQMARIPLGRMGTALEIGASTAFLASEDAAYITGHVLFVDGGITAQLSPPGQPI